MLGNRKPPGIADLINLNNTKNQLDFSNWKPVLNMEGKGTQLREDNVRNTHIEKK